MSLGSERKNSQITNTISRGTMTTTWSGNLKHGMAAAETSCCLLRNSIIDKRENNVYVLKVAEQVYLFVRVDTCV